MMQPVHGFPTQAIATYVLGKRSYEDCHKINGPPGDMDHGINLTVSRPYAAITTAEMLVPDNMACVVDFDKHYAGKQLSPYVLRLRCMTLTGEDVPFPEMYNYVNTIALAPVTQYSIAGFDFTHMPGNFNPAILGVNAVNSFAALCRQCCCSNAPDPVYMQAMKPFLK